MRLWVVFQPVAGSRIKQLSLWVINVLGSQPRSVAPLLFL